MLRKSDSGRESDGTEQKKNEFLSFGGKWIELQSIILSEISQTHKKKYKVLVFI